MKYIIVSDLHANEKALDLFIDYISGINYDRIIFLGDLAGHSGTSFSFIDKFMKLNNLNAVMGNCDTEALHHDTMIMNNQKARTFFESIPRGPVVIDNKFAICHGSVHYENLYMYDIDDTFSSFEYLKESKLKILFFGHIHIPKIYMKNKNVITEDFIEEDIFKLDIHSDYIICPGSLGKPKNSYEYGSFLIYDSKNYTIEKAELKIM